MSKLSRWSTPPQPLSTQPFLTRGRGLTCRTLAAQIWQRRSRESSPPLWWGSKNGSRPVARPQKPAGQRGFFALLLLLLLAPLPAFAVNPDEVLKDPKLEQRARDLSAQLRCMVCQNQSIDDSNAELAKDLRVLVRERITAGDSDEQVINYLVSRYGEFVLLKPRLSARTIALWSTPAVLFLIGGVAVYRLSRRSRPTTGAEKALTAEEQARLAELLRKEEG